MFPTGVFIFTPETVQFYQDFPLSPGKTLQRGAIYRRPDETRQERLSRYLAYRIDRETGKEDVQLSIWSNESMKSSAFEGFHLSDLEFAVKNHHDQLRRILPVMRLQDAPAEDRVRDTNEELRGDVP